MDKKDIPTVSGELRPILEKGKVVNYQIIVICPYCGKLHYHGLASNVLPEPGTNLGHRVNDCKDGIGYFIVAK